MDKTIISELVNFLQHNADGQKIVEQGGLDSSEMHKIAEELVPKITAQVKTSPQSLNSLLEIVAQNTQDPSSLLNSQPGFDQQKAHSEGNDILQSLFGSNGQTSRIVDEIAGKTGISATQINSMLPMLTAMATKVLSGQSATNNENGEGSTYLHQLLGFLDTNKDGSVMDDLGRMGEQWIKKFFGNDNKA